MRTIVWTVMVTVLAVGGVSAQVGPPSGQQSLAATVDVYVFPTEGQTPEQQSKDEATCYSWAVQNTGSDPFALQKQSQQAQQATAEQITNFKKAFSVCLEGHKYMVKY